MFENLVRPSHLFQLSKLLNSLWTDGITRNSSLIHWGRDKMAAIFQTTLSNAFSWMKMLEFRLKFHWSLFLRVQLTIVHHWFRCWLGADQATSHYLNQWWLDYWRIYASLGLNEFKWVCDIYPIIQKPPFFIFVSSYVIYSFRAT